jgi:hypothetical protein
MNGNGELAEVVLAARLVGRLAHRLNRGQQQGQQDGNDGNDHQQLSQGESQLA